MVKTIARENRLFAFTNKCKGKIIPLFLSVILLTSLIVFPTQHTETSTVKQRWGVFTSSGTFLVIVSGTYRLGTWGQQGVDYIWGGTDPYYKELYSNYSGKGGYASGEIYLTVWTYINFTVNVGAAGGTYPSGGSSDFRHGNTLVASRILVAGGDGGSTDTTIYS